MKPLATNSLNPLVRWDRQREQQEQLLLKAQEELQKAGKPHTEQGSDGVSVCEYSIES
jgi:hypothetical protein